MASAPLLTVDEDTLEAIKSCYCKCVSSEFDAVSDEKTDTEKALLEYFDAMKYTEQGIAYDIHDTKYSGSQWDEARDMQHHMIETLSRLRQRIYFLQNSDHELNSPEHVESPPPYSENDPNHHRSQNSASHTNNLTSCLEAASPLLVIPSGVQMYFVSNHTDVSTTPPSYPTSLHVYKLDNLSQIGREHCPQAILQVAEWLYPLSKNQMPVFYSANGAYVFPACSTDGLQTGSAVGIVLSRRLDSRYVEMFESILESYSVFRREAPDECFVDLTEFVEPEQQLGERLASSLVSSAEFLGKGLKKGTNYVTTLIESSSNKVQEHLTPSAAPMSISPMLKSGLYYTHEMSCRTLQLSKQLVCWLCSVTKHISESVKTNTSLFREENTNGILRVTGAGLTGLGRIWKELQNAGSVIAHAVTNATVKNVKYKYGNEAGEAAGLAVGTAVNIGTAAWTIDNIGLNTLAEVTSESGESDRTRVMYESSTETVTIANNAN